MRCNTILIVEGTDIQKSLQYVRDNIKNDDYKTIYIFATSSTQRNIIKYVFHDLKNKIEFDEGTADAFIQERSNAIANMNMKPGMQLYLQLAQYNNNNYILFGDIDQLNDLQKKHSQLKFHCVYINNPNKKQDLQLVVTEKPNSGFWKPKNLLLGLTITAVGIFVAKRDLPIMQSITHIIAAKFK